MRRPEDLCDTVYGECQVPVVRLMHGSVIPDQRHNAVPLQVVGSRMLEDLLESVHVLVAYLCFVHDTFLHSNKLSRFLR